MMNLAHFPISGPKQNPTAEDYALEALHLRNEGARTWRIRGDRGAHFYLLAKRYQSIVRRLSWIPVRKDQAERKSA